jgi:hypothetical protein
LWWSREGKRRVRGWSRKREKKGGKGRDWKDPGEGGGGEVRTGGGVSRGKETLKGVAKEG